MNQEGKEKAIAFLQQAHDALVEDLPKKEFSRESQQQIHASLLYARILELTGGCLALWETNRTAGVPILLRAILECSVDLANIVADADYAQELHLDYISQYTRLLKEGQSGENPYLISLSEEPSVTEQISNWETEIGELKSRGFGKLYKKATRFKKAGMLKEYDSIYNELCSASHNDLRVLQIRHMENEEGGSFGMLLYRDDPAETTSAAPLYAVELLINAGRHIDELLGQTGDSVPELQHGAWMQLSKQLQDGAKASNEPPEPQNAAGDD